MDPIVSENCRIRYPGNFNVGAYSIVDDYSYFATKIEIGKSCHVAANCTIAGGKDYTFTLGDFSGVASGSRIFCRSNSYTSELITITPDHIDIDDKPIEGDVTVGKMCGIGANTVIMPNNNIPEGVAIGALSFVPPQFDFQPWAVYAGNPIQLILPRDKENVLKQAAKLKDL